MSGVTPIICIYHGNCAAGFGAAWVVRKALGSDIEFHAAKYGAPAPDVAGKTVVIVDFSYPKEALAAMAEEAASVLVLDHHKTAQADLHDLPAAEQCCYHPVELAEGIQVLFDMNRSGAGIAWDYFFPGQPRPALINHIEDRDLWLYKLDGTREIISGLFSYPHDFNVWDKLFEQDRRALRALRDDGHAIDRKQRKDVAELVAATKRRLVIGGFDVPVANLPFTFASDAGALMCSGEPFAACYWDTAEGRTFSLRSSEHGEDVSAIAKQYGGGGHRNASGFKVSFDHTLAICDANPEHTLQRLDNLAWILAEGVLILKDQNPDYSDWFTEAEIALGALTTLPPDPANAAIQFALEDDDGMDFLRLWNEGEFDSIRRFWPDAPEEVFIGADPLYRKKTDNPGVSQ